MWHSTVLYALLQLFSGSVLLAGTHLLACRQRQEREREQMLEEGENCQLVLQLPDGSQHSHNFKLGATVAYVKLQVQQLYGVPMEKQLLQTDGKTLIDPCERQPVLFSSSLSSIRHSVGVGTYIYRSSSNWACTQWV